MNIDVNLIKDIDEEFKQIKDAVQIIEAKFRAIPNITEQSRQIYDASIKALAAFDSRSMWLHMSYAMLLAASKQEEK